MIPFLHGVFATNGGVASDFELIETQTVGAGGAASVTFSSIPSTYKHLQIRGIARRSSLGRGDFKININADSGANYSWHLLIGDGSNATSWAATSQTYGRIGYMSGSDSPANVFASNIIDILDYASTSKNKVLRTLAGDDENGAGMVSLNSDAWLSTSALTQITFTPSSGNFAQYSTFSLYGVK